MARTLGARTLEGGNTVEVIGRDTAVARELGGGATSGTLGAVPAGELVILAVPYDSAATIVRQYGEALAGKVIVDISNPLAPGFTGLLTPEGTSAAEEIADAAPADARVVKAFNTIFGHVLATDHGEGRRLDVFLAGDDVQAKKTLSAFVDSIGLRPLDAGALVMAHRLEETALLMMGLGSNGVGDFNFSLAVETHD